MNWTALAEKLLDQGIAIFVLAVILATLLWGLWKIANWTKKEVVIPWVTAQLSLIEELKVRLPRADTKLDLVAQKADTVAKDNHEQLENIRNAINNQTDTLKHVLENQTVDLKHAFSCRA